MTRETDIKIAGNEDDEDVAVVMCVFVLIVSGTVRAGDRFMTKSIKRNVRWGSVR